MGVLVLNGEEGLGGSEFGGLSRRIRRSTIK